jgi:rubrerythrin
VGLLSIEFYQDRSINRKYTDIRKMKLLLGNEIYECQSCGNRQVTAIDKSCGICGMKFDTERRI